ncbi:MAG: DUF4384 domain-containing protein [Desulfobacteraceae bacterium]|nr:MAG: DUF4384 domain-containing protein [Desulfobacteraceae bacterium]
MDDSQTRIQSALGDKYEIKSLIQSGGMGKIFLGVHKTLDKKVAIKIVHQELVKNESIRSRFHREAKLSASLDHSGIIDIYDFGSSQDFDYIIMPFIDGENLQERIKKQGAIEPADGIRIMIEIAEALHYAHTHNVVHRDIKPSNIMFDSQDKIIIADFGISKDMGDSDITAPNTVLGSPKYMSPEQIRGTGVDARSDLYSLGLVFYEMLTGNHPFKGRDTTAVYYAQAHEIPPRPETLRPEVPRALGGIIMKLLEKNPDNRYADGAALLKDLHDYQNGKRLAAAGDDDATLIGDATLIDVIDDATLVDPLPAAAINPITDEAPAPDRTMVSPPVAAAPGFFRKHTKALAGGGLAFLVILSAIFLFSGGSSDEKPAGQPSATIQEPLSSPAESVPSSDGITPTESSQAATTGQTMPENPAQPSQSLPAQAANPSSSLLEAFSTISEKTAGGFSLWTDHDTYRIGETMSFHFKSQQPCYAVILAYTTQKDLVQIYPNHYMSGQFIQANREYSIPEKDMDFDLQVFGPAGEETLIALISDKPFQLFDMPFTAEQPFLSLNEKDPARTAQFFSALSAIKTREFSQQRLAYRITD